MGLLPRDLADCGRHSPNTDLPQSRQLLDTAQLAFVLVRDGMVLVTGDDYGVREPLATIVRIPQ